MKQNYMYQQFVINTQKCSSAFAAIIAQLTNLHPASVIAIFTMIAAACKAPVTKNEPQSDEHVVIHPYNQTHGPVFSANDTNTITLKNWEDGPYNRWAYQHFSTLVPTQPISRDSSEVWRLERDPRKLDTISFTSAAGKPITVRDMINSTYTDAFLVMKDGKIVMEEYFTGMKPSSLHLLQSASKSMMVPLLAIQLGEGKINEKEIVSRYVPDLSRSAYNNAPIGSLMDMQSGIPYSYGTGPQDTASELGRHYKAWGWRPRQDPFYGQRKFLTDLKGQRDTTGKFNYVDADTEVLNWIMESVNQQSFAELFSDRIWSKLGAEFDAYIATDGLGSAVTCGGMNVSLRDFARMGQMFLDKGKANGKQIVPAEFFDDITANGDTAAFAKSMFAQMSPPGSFYNNQFWVLGGHEGAYLALGYGGQYLYVSPKYKTVIAKFSTHASFDPEGGQNEFNGFHAIARSLGSGK